MQFLEYKAPFRLTFGLDRLFIADGHFLSDIVLNFVNLQVRVDKQGLVLFLDFADPNLGHGFDGLLNDFLRLVSKL